MPSRHFISYARSLLAFSAMTACIAASAYWAEAERLFGVPADLLYAVAMAESDLNPAALNLSHLEQTGTYDLGLMQINSSHFASVRAAGIADPHLYDPCTSIKVGAWLMAQAFARHGHSWSAVGSYNAACTSLKGAACEQARSRYAWRVYRRLPRSRSAGGGTAAPPTPATAAPAHSAFILSARGAP